MTYQIVVDVWEGNPDIDADILLGAGVAGMIVRLNDMVGGHHMDADFPALWKIAQRFPVHYPYFVYNPWVDGKANFKWLCEHVPSDIDIVKVSCDIEVKYAGYSPVTYAKEVEVFKKLVLARFPKSDFYTGLWFMEMLSSWPKDIPYWWARYMYSVYPDKSTPITWQELTSKLNAIQWNPDPTKACPGVIKKWQITCDRYILPGCGNTKIDISIENCTLQELIDESMGTGNVPAQEPTIEEKVASLLREARIHGWNV